MGYQELVAAELASEALVWGPAENGGNSANVLAHLDGWVIRRKPEIVHLNCGLHDLRAERGSAVKAVPLDDYRRNLDHIFDRIRRETDAAVIWATTTPVNEERHRRNKSFDRFEADVVEYNCASLKIAERAGAMINDLFEAVIQAGRDSRLSSDGVHFTPSGSQLLGKAVVAAIRECLRLRPLAVARTADRNRAFGETRDRTCEKDHSEAKQRC